MPTSRTIQFSSIFGLPKSIAGKSKPLLVLSLMATASAMAQNIPNAGQSVQQQMQTPMQPPQGGAAFSLPIPSESSSSPKAGSSGGLQLSLQSIRLTGQTLFSEEALLSAVGEIKGKTFDFAGLEKIAESIADFYHRNGYPFASASLPAQEIKDGVLTIEIIEGRYGVISSSGEFLSEEAAPFLENLKPGNVIEAKLLERTLLILDDLPMISVSPRMLPGQSFGAGNLDVKITRNAEWGGEVGLDNLGSRYTGEYRARATINAYSKFMFGDMIRMSSITTNQKLWLGSVDYEAPLNGLGLRGQIGYARTTYQLGKDYSYLNASGFANVLSTKINYPVVRTQLSNLSLSMGYVHKALQDRYQTSSTQYDKTSRALPFSVLFDQRDSFGGGGLTYGNVMLTRGYLTLDNSLTALDSVSAQTQGNFNKVNFELARMQTLPANFSWFGRVATQSAGKNLDSSEKFNLGGVYGVRAYPIGEALGDRGWLVQMEFRYKLDEIMGFILVDGGSATANSRPWDSNSQSKLHLSGRGIGARLQQELGWNWEMSMAWRTTGEPLSDKAVRTPRIWAFATYKF